MGGVWRSGCANHITGGMRCEEEGREKYARDKYVKVWRFGAFFVVYLFVY